VGDLVLLWDKKSEKERDHGKFDRLWLGPYLINVVVGPNTLYLMNLNGERGHLSVNGQRLKLYFP
jgi:hypothetical protein